MKDISLMTLEEYLAHDKQQDKRILDAAKAEWLSIIRSLWIVIGKQVEEERMKIYMKSLQSVPLEILETAINNIINSHTYSTVPNLGEIWKEIKLELTRCHCNSVDEWLSRQPSGIYFMEPEVAI